MLPKNEDQTGTNIGLKKLWENVKKRAKTGVCHWIVLGLGYIIAQSKVVQSLTNPCQRHAKRVATRCYAKDTPFHFWQ